MDFSRVGHFKSVLDDEGIRTFIKNANASSLMGEVPYTEVWPEIWVLNDHDAERAGVLINELERSRVEHVAPWLCPECETYVEDGFSECWNCGHSQPV